MLIIAFNENINKANVGLSQRQYTHTVAYFGNSLKIAVKVNTDNVFNLNVRVYNFNMNLILDYYDIYLIKVNYMYI